MRPKPTLYDEERLDLLHVQEAKKRLLQEDRITLKESIDDIATLFQCYKALSVVEAIQAILLREDTCPKEDHNAILSIMDDAYSYWDITEV